MAIDLGSAFGRIILEAQDALDQTGKVGQALGGLAGPAGMMAGAIGAAGVAAGGALIALGASSVGVAREFESAMAVMSTAVDPLSVGAQTTAEAMGILGDASLAVGSDTSLIGVSASTAAEAMTGLYKAGLSTGEIFGDLQGYMAGTTELSGALRASIDLAAASELDMVAASDLAAITLATFGGHLETEAERAEFINQAMNNFVQTADGSVASVGDLADAFINVGSTAAGMGIPLEDMNTALGILSTRGIAGAEAGTAFKSMLTNMMTAPKAADALDELGVSLYDVSGQMRPLEQIVGDLETAMAGMTDEQRTQTTVALASSYGQKALNALLAEGAAGWAGMEEAIAGAATMEETAAARTNTLAGAQEALSGVWESFRIKVGTGLIPVLTSLSDIGASLIERYGPTLTTLFENVGNGIQRIVDVVQNGQLGELFTVFEDGSSVLGGIFESFGMGEEQATNLATGISNVVTSVQNFIAPVADFVQNHGPLLLQILGGLAVAFGAFTIITTVVGWVSSLIGVISGIGTAITAAGGGITGLIAILGGPLTLVIGAIAAAIGLFAVAWRNDWGGIQGKVQEVIAFLQPLIQGWLAGLSAWWSATWPQLQATLQTVWGIIQSVIQSAIAVIGPAIQTFLAALGPIWEQLKSLWPPIMAMWEAAKPVLLGVLTAIGAALATAVALITGIITGLSRAIGPIVQGVIGAVKGIVTAMTGVFQTLQGVFRLIVGLFTGNGELIKQGWEQLKDGVVNIVSGLVDGITSLIGGLVEGVFGFVTGLVDGVVGFFKNLYDQLVGHSIVTDLVERIQELWESLWNKVKEIVQIGVDLVVGIIDNFRSLFEGDWETFRDRIGEVWQEAWDKVMEIAEGLWDKVSIWLGGLWDDIKGWFTDTDWAQLGLDVVNGIINGLSAAGQSIVDTIMSFVQSAWDAVKKFFGIASPSTLMYWAGQMIAQGLIDGIRSMQSTAAEAMDALFSAMGNVSGLAGGFGTQFQRQVLDPLRNSLRASQEGLDDVDAAIERMTEQLGYDPGFARTPGAILELMRRANYQYATEQEKATARTLLAFLRDRNRLNQEHLRLQRELEAQESRLALLQEKQQQNDFLQEQLKLIQFIRDNNLSADILAGLEFGIGADAGALMDAMRRALEQMIRTAEDELGIGSPSRVFRQIATQVKQGLIVEMRDSRAVARAARGMVSNMVDAAQLALDTVGSGAAGSMVDSSRRMTMYGGQHFYFQQRRGSVLEEVQGLLAP